MKTPSVSLRFTSTAVVALGLLAGTVLAADAPSTSGDRPERPERAGGPGGPGGPGGREGGRGGGMMRMMPLMVALDTNQDGELSAEEIANAPAALKTLDKNKDGKLSADELRPNFGDGPRGGQDRRSDPQELVNRLMASDKNGDGKLTADELPERMRSLLERGDKDKDGALSKEELTALVASDAGLSGGRGRDREGGGERRREGGPSTGAPQ